MSDIEATLMNISEEKRLKNKSRTIYYLFMVGWFIGLAALIGIVMSYVYRGRSHQSWLDSHFDFQVKTFWYGVVYLGLSLMLAPFLVGVVIWLFWIYWVVKRSLNGLAALKEEREVRGGFFSLGIAE